jgi:hypothetical protein
MAGRLMGAWWRALDANGNPASGAKAYFYESGTDIPQNTFTTAVMTAPRSNPVVADSAGWFPEIWGDVSQAYRVEVTDALGNVLYGPQDDITPVGVGAAVAPASYSSNTTLSLSDLGRRISATGATSWTLTLPVGTGLPPGWWFEFVNEGTGTITIVPSGGDTIDGALSTTVGPVERMRVTLSAAATFITDDFSTSIGRHSIWIPVDAMIGRLTNGPGVTADESSVNKVMLRTFDFDPATNEFAQLRIAMPKSWNEGTVTFAPVWLHNATTTNFKVSWGLQGASASDGDASDAAFGTAQYSNDTGGVTGTLYRGPESAPITIAGSPAAEDVVIFQVLRKADDGTNDTMAIDARLVGFALYINTSTGTDA